MTGNTITVGQPWDNDLFTIPTDMPSFGWHHGQFLVLGDPDGRINVDQWATAPLRLAFAEHKGLVITMLKSPALPGSMVESPRPYLIGDPPPEITIEEGDHILWQLCTVSRGIIVNLRAFTTSPQVTVWLRRTLAAQRANGPISYDHASMLIADWQQSAPTDKAAWKRAEVTCLAGD